MYEKTFGAKYEATKNLATVEIAKLIRADIKAAIEAGTLPRGKYSVRSSHGSGRSIDVRIQNLEGVRLLSVEWVRWRAEHEDHETPPAGFVRYSAVAQAAVDTLKAIHWSYNYDGSDSQTDYFNVRYYGDASIAWEYEKAQTDLYREIWANEEGRALLTTLADKERAERHAAEEARFAKYAAEKAAQDAEFAALRENAPTLATADAARCRKCAGPLHARQWWREQGNLYRNECQNCRVDSWFRFDDAYAAGVRGSAVSPRRVTTVEVRKALGGSYFVRIAGFDHESECSFDEAATTAIFSDRRYDFDSARFADDQSRTLLEEIHGFAVEPQKSAPVLRLVQGGVDSAPAEEPEQVRFLASLGVEAL